MSPNGEIIFVNFSIKINTLLEIIEDHSCFENISQQKLSTRKGDYLQKISFDDISDGHSNNVTMLFKYANKNSTDLTFSPFHLKNASYFTFKSLTGSLLSLFLDITTHQDVLGNIKLYTKDLESLWVENGVLNKKYYIDFIKGENSNANSYNPYNLKINITLKEYFASNKKFQKDIESKTYKTPEEKLNAIGLKLLQMKTDDELEYAIFIDLFRQVVLMGANNPILIKFSKILI